MQQRIPASIDAIQAEIQALNQTIEKETKELECSNAELEKIQTESDAIAAQIELLTEQQRLKSYQVGQEKHRREIDELEIQVKEGVENLEKTHAQQALLKKQRALMAEKEAQESILRGENIQANRNILQEAKKTLSEFPLSEAGEPDEHGVEPSHLFHQVSTKLVDQANRIGELSRELEDKKDLLVTAEANIALTKAYIERVLEGLNGLPQDLDSDLYQPRINVLKNYNNLLLQQKKQLTDLISQRKELIKILEKARQGKTKKLEELQARQLTIENYNTAYKTLIELAIPDNFKSKKLVDYQMLIAHAIQDRAIEQGDAFDYKHYTEILNATTELLQTPWDINLQNKYYLLAQRDKQEQPNDAKRIFGLMIALLGFIMIAFSILAKAASLGLSSPTTLSTAGIGALAAIAGNRLVKSNGYKGLSKAMMDTLKTAKKIKKPTGEQQPDPNQLFYEYDGPPAPNMPQYAPVPIPSTVRKKPR